MPAAVFQVTGLVLEDARQKLEQEGWQTYSVCLTRAPRHEGNTRTPLRVVRARPVGKGEVQLVVARECAGVL